jgi:demethylmenaquinone methyltransferase/2-methoxy-6-polyprenyl-1,4-benzoquinol methylase
VFYFGDTRKRLAEIMRFKVNGVFVILETSVPDKTPYKKGIIFTVKHPANYW